MAIKQITSFASGEIDPVLHDRTTLEKFRTGLDTARNVIIGKTGSILSRFSRAHFLKAKNNNEKIKLFSPPNSGVLTEWGDLYVRVYNFTGTLLHDVTTVVTEDQLEDVHFESTDTTIYVFRTGETPLSFDYSTGSFIAGLLAFETLSGLPVSATVAVSGTIPTGYDVDYAVTIVVNGEEYQLFDLSAQSAKLPVSVGESNNISVNLGANGSIIDEFTELRVYRRPESGSAFGFIGSSSNFSLSGSDVVADFEDVGAAADFLNSPPQIVTKLGLGGSSVRNLDIATGLIYQKRLLLSPDIDRQAILASRPGYRNNFYRDFPYGIDSALLFKSGSSGGGKILRMIEADGLIVFTDTGVFTNSGLLTINNQALLKRGNWIIDVKVPPLVVPGGIFFVEKDTNAVKQLIFSDTIGTYQTIEHSIFSNHIFRGRTILSWCFQDGESPLIIVNFNDGTWATLTYQFEHQMRAWARHDGVYPVEQIEGTTDRNTSFFVINKDGQRYISVSLPRFIPSGVSVSNPEADKLALNSFMDDVKTTSNLLNDSLSGSDVFTLTPVTSGVWDGDLTLTCGTSGLFPDPGLGEIGTVFRFFDVNDKTIVDLEVTARASDNSVTVEPSSEFPSNQANGFNLYELLTTITGLNHLEGETVGVFSDGYVVSSPNNDKDSTNTYTVSSGSITLQSGDEGAIVVVGRPITADIKTLNINTVSQSPTTVESLTVNKLYVRVNETRGLYCNNFFPEEASKQKDGNSVADMENLDFHDVDVPNEIIGNRYKEPSSRRLEVTIDGDYESNGKMAFRQVDPVHFEILSIIPDVEVFPRRN